MSRSRRSYRLGTTATVAAIAGLLALTALAQRAMGRIWWCRQGGLSPWSWDIWSPHNSQHLLDPYTPSHVLHGLLFYAGLYLIFRNSERVSAGLRLVIATGIEAAWEILENTPMIIQRYREATISLDYNGDSILNSSADVIACIVGYGLARVLPVRVSVAVFFLTEIVTTLWIHDGLLLNILMLVWPIDVVRQWQMPGP